MEIPLYMIDSLEDQSIYCLLYKQKSQACTEINSQGAKKNNGKT